MMQDADVQIPSSYTKIQAQVALKQFKAALHEVRQSCRDLNPESSPDKGMVALVMSFPTSILAQFWVGVIEKAEVPNPLSARDGTLLRKIPVELHIPAEQLMKDMTKTLQGGLSRDAAEGLVDAWTEGRKPGRGLISLMRSSAYASAGQWGQALKDAQTANSYPPTFIKRRYSSRGWPRAHAAFSQAMEGLQVDNTSAALHMATAHNLETNNEEYAEALDRLVRRIPEAHADALQLVGAKALEQTLAAEAEEALPEFKKKRPKYYYYYKWMTERITKVCGELPAPVLQKLICIDATELDMLLTYPSGIEQQAQKLLKVLDDEGLQALSKYRLPLLSWKEAQQLKAQHALLTSGPGEGINLPSASPAHEHPILGSIVEEEDLDAPDLI